MTGKVPNQPVSPDVQAQQAACSCLISCSLEEIERKISFSWWVCGCGVEECACFQICVLKIFRELLKKNQAYRQLSGCTQMSLIHKRSPLLTLLSLATSSHVGTPGAAAPGNTLSSRLKFALLVKLNPSSSCSGKAKAGVGVGVLVCPPSSGPLACSPLYLGLPASESIARGRILSHMKENVPPLQGRQS